MQNGWQLVLSILAGHPMTEEEMDLLPSAIEPWWQLFDRIWWQAMCQIQERSQQKYEAAAELYYRNREKLHAMAEDYGDLEPYMAVKKMFEKGLA